MNEEDGSFDTGGRADPQDQPGRFFRLHQKTDWTWTPFFPPRRIWSN